MESKFVHLRTRTQYSLLQGAIHVEELVKKTQSLGMDAVAITDTNNLFGAIDFYMQAKSKGLKPIIGTTLWYLENGYVQAQQEISQALASGPASQNFKPKFHELVILCKSLEGYQNLCRLITESYKNSPPPQKGQQQIPKFLIDRAGLDQYGKDWIILSGGLKGEVPYKLLMDDEEEAITTAKWFQSRFKDNYYFELQDNGLPEQDHVNQALYALGEKLGIPVVATCDAHYLTPDQADAHEIFQCIENGRNLDFDRPKSLTPKEFYVKDPALMHARFERFTGACANTLKIADQCDLQFKFKDSDGKPIYHLPRFRPDGVSKTDPFDAIEYFRTQSRAGLKKRFASYAFIEKTSDSGWAELKKVYEDRLEQEMNMIENTGFSGYFLIVSDFILWAKSKGIPVGPGRGSGAGSIVAYSLFITDIDPIEFNLLFERFINPERVSMPDFDVDFCQDRRAEVIHYVQEKYGRDNVCQIITFGKLQTRAALKDVGRVLGLSFAETDEINKLIPEVLGISIDQAIQTEPRLRERMEQDHKVNTVVQYARTLEGLYRNAGIHAAGVIITEEPVVNYCPLYVGKDGDVVTQFEKDSAEKVGLVKFDFLGLKTLTVIDNAIKLIKPIQGEAPFELEKMNYKDPEVFALISSGDTDGVFQVESSGMKDLCARIQPSSLEDLTAINALYRPGPLGSGMVDDFIDRKHGRNPIVYDVEMLAPILKDTYGVILYQEQVMQIARELAGYSLGQADLLRRAMGKKKADEMAEHRQIFVNGALKKNLPVEKAEGIFDLMAKFAEYGFNKSHSAAYGVLTYQTAYLKTHYPAEFMAALMTTEINDTDKITRYIADAKAHHITILPPDVNHSQKNFSVEGKAIRFGLEAIKGVGGIAVDTILEARAEGEFTGVLEFCKRVSTRKVNKKVLEALTVAGAFDEISEVNRPSLLGSIEKLLEVASDEQAEKELGQTSLFDSFSAEDVKLMMPTSSIFKDEADWPRSKKLMMEKQTVGFYVSGHPMDTWQKICEEWLGWSTEKIRTHALEKFQASQNAPALPAATRSPGGGYQRAKRPELRVAGLMSEMREVMTKKGSRMAFGRMEDLYGSLELVFFPDAFEACSDTLKRAAVEAEPLLVTGELEATPEGGKILVKTLEWIEEAHKNRVQEVVLRLPLGKVTPEQMRELKRHMLSFRGRCGVRIEFIHPQFKTRLHLPKTVGLQASPQMVESLNRVFGFDVVHLI